MNAILNPATAAAIATPTALLSLCPAYVAPTEIRKHKQAGPTVQVTARKIKGGKWEGVFRDKAGRGVESANHPTEEGAIKAVAFYADATNANTTGAA